MSSPVEIALYSVAVVWSLLLLWLAADRYRHERLARRLSTWKERLQGTASADESRLRAIVGELSVAELDAVLRGGLPASMEVAVARAMQQHRQELLRDAAGAPDVWARIRAVRILAAARAKERYDLVDQMLRSGTPVLAATAIRILARMDDHQSADLLVRALRDGVYSRSRIAAAIDTMSVARTDLLKPLFDASEPQVRFWAARLAGRINAPQCRVHVRRLATDVDPLVRRAAVETLGVFRNAADLPLLLQALKDPVTFVRIHAARACAHFGSPEIADALVALLPDRNWTVRAAARDALQRIGPTAIPVVMQTLWHSDNFAASSAAEVLHRTGGAAQIARQILADTDSITGRSQRAMLARFLAVGGPYLRTAFLGQLSNPERLDLLGRLEPLSDAH